MNKIKPPPLMSNVLPKTLLGGGLARGSTTVLLLTLILSAPTLQAHNVVAGAYVDGMLIEGEIAFSNGEAALPGVLVEVFIENGQKVGETQTAADGLFSFTALSPEKHILKADLGAGHVAEIVVEAGDFTAAKKPAKSTAKDSATLATNAVAGISATELETIVRKAVAQQVKPLQKELRAYKEKVMIRDIAGGLGFIFGLFGVAAWMASRKPPKSDGGKS